MGASKVLGGPVLKGIDYNDRRWWSKVGMHEIEVMGDAVTVLDKVSG